MPRGRRGDAVIIKVRLCNNAACTTFWTRGLGAVLDGEKIY